MTLTIPEWPPASSIFFVRAAQTYSAWLRYVPPMFAIAMLTNAEFESAFKANIIGDHGEAFSFYQWHWSARGQQILAATGIDVRLERSVTRIVDAAWWELNNTEKHAFDAIMAAKTVEDATRAACRFFEGAGAPDAVDRRALGADRWVSWIAMHPPT